MEYDLRKSIALVVDILVSYNLAGRPYNHKKTYFKIVVTVVIIS